MVLLLLVYKSFSCILNMLYQTGFADSFPRLTCLAGLLMMCLDKQNLFFILINCIWSCFNCMVISFCGLRNLLQQRFPSRSFTVFVFALRSYSFEVTIYILFKIWYNSPPFLYICVFSCSNIICWKSLENEQTCFESNRFIDCYTGLIDYSIESLKIGHCEFSRFFL